MLCTLAFWHICQDKIHTTEFSFENPHCGDAASQPKSSSASVLVIVYGHIWRCCLVFFHQNWSESYGAYEYQWHNIPFVLIFSLAHMKSLYVCH